MRQSEGATKGHGLRRREPAEEAQGGPKQLVQAGEGEVGLRLDAPRGQYVHVARAPAGVLEEGRLTDPRPPANHERAAP